jgi:hypothetical protein
MAGQVADGRHQIAQQAGEGGGHVAVAGRDVFAGAEPG